MENCVFNVSFSRCGALTTKRCKDCGFCKTREQLEEGRARAKQRVSSLPNAERLVEKYGEYTRCAESIK